MSSTESKTFEELRKEYDELKEALKCPICLEIFNKESKILPCLHSFCTTCLDKHIIASPDPYSPICSCPVCRTSFMISPGVPMCPKEDKFVPVRLEELQKLRFRLEELSGKTASLDLDIELCDVCKPPKDREDATSRCVDCNKNLCEKHLYFHEELLPEHKTIDISDFSSSSPSPSGSSSSSSSSAQKVLFCEEHKTSPLEFFCTDCKTPICTLCFAIGDHKKHPIVLIADQVKGKRETMISTAGFVEDRLKELDTSLLLIEMMETKIQEKMMSQKEIIVSSFLEYRRKLDKKLVELKKDFNDVFMQKTNEKLAVLDAQEKEVRDEIKNYENATEVAFDFASNATDQQLLLMYPVIVKELKRYKDDKNMGKIKVAEEYLRISWEAPERFPSQPPFPCSLVEIPHAIVTRPFNVIEGFQAAQPVQPPMEAPRDSSSSSSSSSSSPSVPQQVVKKASVKPRDYKKVKKAKFFFGKAGKKFGELHLPTNFTVDHHGNILISDTVFRVSMFDNKGKIIRSFGSMGVGNSQFNYPSGILVDPRTDEIFVCDHNNNRIQAFDYQGNFLRIIGSPGSANGEFTSPFAVKLNSLDQFVVSDTDNHRIQMFDRNWNHIRSFGNYGQKKGQLMEPMGLAIDSHDNVFVAEYGNSRISVFDKQGKFLKAFGVEGARDGQFMKPTGIAIDLHDNIVVIEHHVNRVQFFDPSGRHISSLIHKAMPAPTTFPSVVVDHLNNLYACFPSENKIHFY